MSRNSTNLFAAYSVTSAAHSSPRHLSLGSSEIYFTDFIILSLLELRDRGIKGLGIRGTSGLLSHDQGNLSIRLMMLRSLGHISNASFRNPRAAYVSIRQHTSAHVSTRASATSLAPQSRTYELLITPRASGAWPVSSIQLVFVYVGRGDGGRMCVYGG